MASAMPDGRADELSVLAVDVGTTAVKAAVLDGHAALLGAAAVEQRTYGAQDGTREHQPVETWAAVDAAIAAALAVTPAPGRRLVRAVVVTGPRGSFAIRGPRDEWLTPFITWQDRRAAREAAELASRIDDRFREITGSRLDPAVVAPKLAWLRAADPAAFLDQWRMTTPQGALLQRLGADDDTVDLSVAGHSGLLDVRTLSWSEELLATFAVSATSLPRLVSPGTIVGTLHPTAAARWGLEPGITLVAAGSDGVCAELGAGVTRFGQLYAYLGTAAAVAGPLEGALLPGDASLTLMPGSRPDRWRLLGLAMAGGSARDWFMRAAGHTSHAAVDRLVAASPPGARGVLFVPTLAGASAPLPDGRARGVFAGLTLATDPADLARAVHEGVALEILWLVRAIAAMTTWPDELRLTGGGGQSTIWPSVLADVAGVPVARIRDPNTGVRGAAAYGLTALGLHADVTGAAAAIDLPCDRFTPDPARRAVYEEAAATYARIRQAFYDAELDEQLYRYATPNMAGGNEPEAG